MVSYNDGSRYRHCLGQYADTAQMEHRFLSLLLQCTDRYPGLDDITVLRHHCLAAPSINSQTLGSVFFHVEKLHIRRPDVFEWIPIEQASTRNDWRCSHQFLNRSGSSVWRRQKGERFHYSRVSCRSHIHKYWIIMIEALPANPTNTFDGGVTLSMEECNAFAIFLKSSIICWDKQKLWTS